MAEGDGAESTGTGSTNGTTEGSGGTPPEGQQQDTGATTEGQQVDGQGEGQGTDNGEPQDRATLEAALAAARDERKQAKAEARKEREAREALERERMSDADKAVADARAEGVAEGNRRLARAAVREAAVAANYADGKDAVVFLADDGLERFVDPDSGDVDEGAVNEAVAELAKRKPHLLRQATTRSKGGADLTGDGQESDPVDEFNALLRSG